MAHQEGTPRQSLAALDVIAIIVGLVIGAGIFKAPALVAANVGSEAVLALAWLLGGVVSLIGALCYAELASAYPHTGGEYHYLRRAYGRGMSFLFAWSRLVVLQTGSIALLAFVLGDYAAELVPLGAHGPAIYAAAAVVVLTGVNVVGLALSKWTQNTLTILTLSGLCGVILVGLFVAPAAMPAEPVATSAGHAQAFGLAMIFVLLTYGGWNEAAYVSAELRNTRRNMVRVLVAGIAIITTVYLLVNLAYVRVLGLDGMSGSEVVTADLMRMTVGEGGARLVTALIVVAVFASINVTILTGARTNYALARDFPLFGFLGHWHSRANAPINALLVQGAIAMVLVFFGALGRSGFETMVYYVSPVFWLFFLMTGLSVLVLRQREPERERPFRVPLYPVTPVLFMLACGYMLYSSLAYAGIGAIVGVLVLLAGVPLLVYLYRVPLGAASLARRTDGEP
jgi:basic amino acid/polyamine antiporter, APA family